MDDIREYIHGRCQIFAFALNIALGYPMTFVWDSGDEPDNDMQSSQEPLVHAYCTRADGTLVDAGGTVSRQDAETGHGDCWEADHREIGAAAVKRLIRDKVLGGPRPGELSELVRYIRSNPDIYRDGARQVEAE